MVINNKPFATSSVILRITILQQLIALLLLAATTRTTTSCCHAFVLPIASSSSSSVVASTTATSSSSSSSSSSSHPLIAMKATASAAAAAAVSAEQDLELTRQVLMGKILSFRGTDTRRSGKDNVGGDDTTVTITNIAQQQSATKTKIEEETAKTKTKTTESKESKKSLSSLLFREIQPLKAAMLTKTWQGLMLDVEEKVGVVPELGKTSVSIRRSGSEMPRRQLCKKQFLYMYESTFALALADKTESSEGRIQKRKAIPSLVMDGKLVGQHCFTYASLTQPSALALVVKQEEINNDSNNNNVVWSILALSINPTERKIDSIVAAEKTALMELYQCAQQQQQQQVGTTTTTTTTLLRIAAKAKETLAGSNEQLCLQPMTMIIEDNNENENEQQKEEWFQFDSSLLSSSS